MAMTNAEWLVKNKYDFSSIYLVDKHDGSFKIMYQNGRNCIGEAVSTTSAGALIVWLSAEHKGPILNDAERRYLKDVIRPFRGRAVFVKKIYHTGYTVDYEQIIIRVKSIATLIADIPLPFFKKGEMYKGMNLNREYTLEELGL